MTLVESAVGVLDPVERERRCDGHFELARFGVDTTIIVPGTFPTGTNHYASAGHPADTAVARQYDELYGGLLDQIPARQTAMSDPGADPADVARQITRVVDLPKGKRPFRVHIDPEHDGAEEAFTLGDRLRATYLHRLGLSDLLAPAAA